MATTGFDRKSVQQVSDGALEKLKAYAEGLGMTVSRGSGSFTSTDFTLKFVFRLPEVGGVSREKVEWDRYCKSYGLDKDDFGRTFLMPNGECKLVGFKPRATKMPVIVCYTSNPSKRYKVSDEYVRKMLNKPFAWEKKLSA